MSADDLPAAGLQIQREQPVLADDLQSSALFARCFSVQLLDHKSSGSIKKGPTGFHLWGFLFTTLYSL
ncbi:MAG: hypothetical protein HY869_03130 [Chloroflexi bacterium]|nr:hypothetical protein [Chloroflexota bacterium]